MLSRPQRLIAVAASAVLVTSTALTALGESAAQAKTHASPWIQLSSGYGVGASNQPRVVRWQGKLLVTWSQEITGNLSYALKTRTLLPTAKVAGPASTAATWSSITDDPAPFLLGGVPTIAFGGLRSLDTTDAYSGEMAYVQAPDASTWTLGSGSLTYSRSAYGDYGFGAIDDGTGQVLTAGVYSSSDHLTVHHGIDPAAPATTPDIDLAGTGGDAQNANVARDLVTGTSYALWYSSASDGTQQGIRAAQIWPTQSAPMPPAPLSTVTFEGAKNSINTLQDVGVVGRIGGGVWAVYPSGYPESHQVVLWKVGTSQKLTIHTAGDAQYPGIAVGPGGRLWVYWIEGSVVHAVRTNPSVTKWGVVRTLDSPHADGESPTHTAGDGTLGPLDAVLTVANKPLVKGGNPASQIFSTRILEGLRVGVSPAKISYKTGGNVTVTVTDAGVPVPGATVKIGSKTATTNLVGKAVIAWPALSTKGTHIVTASETGWWPGTSSFKVH
jgi:hypothetical protein